jgi:hypothetical protein
MKIKLKKKYCMNCKFFRGLDDKCNKGRSSHFLKPICEAFKPKEWVDFNEL